MRVAMIGAGYVGLVSAEEIAGLIDRSRPLDPRNIHRPKDTAEQGFACVGVERSQERGPEAVAAIAAVA